MNSYPWSWFDENPFWLHNIAIFFLNKVISNKDTQLIIRNQEETLSEHP